MAKVTSRVFFEDQKRDDGAVRGSDERIGGLTFAYGVFRWIKRAEPPEAPPAKR